MGGQAAQDHPVPRLDVEHDLPDGMRRPNRPRRRALRRDAPEYLEQRGAVPRTALEGAPLLIGQMLHLVHSCILPLHGSPRPESERPFQEETMIRACFIASLLLLFAFSFASAQHDHESAAAGSGPPPLYD